MSNKKDPIIEALKVQAKIHMTQAAIDKLFPADKSWDEMTPEQQAKIKKQLEIKQKQKGINRLITLAWVLLFAFVIIKVLMDNSG